MPRIRIAAPRTRASRGTGLQNVVDSWRCQTEHDGSDCPALLSLSRAHVDSILVGNRNKGVGALSYKGALMEEGRSSDSSAAPTVSFASSLTRIRWVCDTTSPQLRSSPGGT